MEDKFDILFLCHEKDKELLKKSVYYAQKNVKNYRKIFLVSNRNFLESEKNIEFVSETKYPFTKKDFDKYASDGRGSWYYQQFLKLYFFNIMGNKVLDNLLIIDADTMFIRKTSFFENDIPLYNFETGYHQPYYHILEKLFGFGKQKSNISGITHHMLIQKKYIEEIFNFVEKKERKEFWKAIMTNIDADTISGFSEYDLYFNYMLKKHPSKIKIRRIRFINFPAYSKGWINFFRFLGYYYLSSHHYLRESKFPRTKSLFFEFLREIGLKKHLKKIFIQLKIVAQK